MDKKSCFVPNSECDTNKKTYSTLKHDPALKIQIPCSMGHTLLTSCATLWQCGTGTSWQTSS